jgi:hypothetical protein|tara:strand:+ start:2602 stop:3213 length:612 start_codon:yes stop_codon:yes gene_type:complete
MANQDAAFGFRQVGGLGSRPTSNGTSKYVIASGYTSAIYAGDIVEMGAGTDESGAAIAAGYIGQAAATSSTRNLGIFNGCFYDDPTTRKPTFNNYWPGDINVSNPAAGATAFVYDDPADLFEVQTSGTINQTYVGRSIDMAYTAGTAVTNGRSKEEIGATSYAGTGQMALIRVSEDPSNSDETAANSNWIVKFNEHVYYNNAL